MWNNDCEISIMELLLSTQWRGSKSVRRFMRNNENRVVTQRSPLDENNDFPKANCETHALE